MTSRMTSWEPRRRAADNKQSENCIKSPLKEWERPNLSRGSHLYSYRCSPAHSRTNMGHPEEVDVIVCGYAEAHVFHACAFASNHVLALDTVAVPLGPSWLAASPTPTPTSRSCSLRVGAHL